MSAKCDAQEKIRLLPENSAALREIAAKLVLPISYNALANIAVSIGISHLRDATRRIGKAFSTKRIKP